MFKVNNKDTRTTLKIKRLQVIKRQELSINNLCSCTSEHFKWLIFFSLDGSGWKKWKLNNKLRRSIIIKLALRILAGKKHPKLNSSAHEK